MDYQDKMPPGWTLVRRGAGYYKHAGEHYAIFDDEGIARGFGTGRYDTPARAVAAAWECFAC